MSGTESQRYESAHDPMCPIAHSPTTVNRIRELVEETPEGRAALERSAEQWCECPLIAKVRADEREKAASLIPDVFATAPFVYPNDNAAIEFVQEYLRNGGPHV